ncbi:hypothetical protein F4802DRAFT_583218 [Xylaria palmicola]|nr:hypothetical protein F4802DRAFT_583218 [Xylaria palmicola]
MAESLTSSQRRLSACLSLIPCLGLPLHDAFAEPHCARCYLYACWCAAGGAMHTGSVRVRPRGSRTRTQRLPGSAWD